MGRLAVRTVAVAAKPPFTWRHEAVFYTSSALRKSIIPLTVSIFFFVMSYCLVILGLVLKPIGAVDRQPAGIFIGCIRELAVWIATMVFAGVIGSATTADIGARKIREELDALSVLGIDTVRTLVVPRVVGLTVAAPILGMICLAISQAVNYAIGPSFLDLPPAVFRDSFKQNVLPIDIWSALLKYTVIGFFVGVVSCQKGLTSKGGAEGVGRAVNESVVITFVGIWAINGLYNLTYLSLFPSASVLRG